MFALAYEQQFRTEQHTSGPVSEVESARSAENHYTVTKESREPV